jgi:hypothetical protein
MKDSISYVYLHRRLDTNEVFYVGIGKKPLFQRAYTKHGRNRFWHNIVKKINYSVDIVYKDILWEQACKYEINLIAMYGRRDLKTGSLVNLTSGGEGACDFSVETRIKIGSIHKGKIVSQETRDKMKNSHKGILHSDFRKQKCGNAHKKLILDTSTGIMYEGAKEAALALNINCSTLRNWLSIPRLNKSTLIYTK